MESQWMSMNQEVGKSAFSGHVNLGRRLFPQRYMWNPSVHAVLADNEKRGDGLDQESAFAWRLEPPRLQGPVGLYSGNFAEVIEGLLSGNSSQSALLLGP
ncbi:Glutathione Reductase [Manis pentadactyla]|nr:Glutathione Reductase [Manis pentadactyla]